MNRKVKTPTESTPQASNRKTAYWLFVPAAIVLAACVFALIRFAVWPQNTQALGQPGTAAPVITVSLPARTPEPTLTPTPVPTPTSTPTPTPTVDPTMWGAKFPGKFTGGQAVQTDDSYRSAHVNVALRKIQQDGHVFFVADIYVTDLKYFASAFAGFKYKSGKSQHVDEMAKALNAVIAVDGDFYNRNGGPLVRGGVQYNQAKQISDSLVLYNDGTMVTFPKGTLNLKTELAKGVWQIWNFGPELLDGGQPMTKFHSSVTSVNPRTAIGYYEPGHYCLVVEDGRQPGYSQGIQMKDWSLFFYNLGCKAAFNLDGGGSTQMAFMGKLVNSPCSDYRRVADMVYIADEP